MSIGDTNLKYHYHHGSQGLPEGQRRSFPVAEAVAVKNAVQAIPILGWRPGPDTGPEREPLRGSVCCNICDSDAYFEYVDSALD